ncbi:MAG: aspartate-semialdehyde dehydrogenase, partial [Anaplasmataceae bacterium]|nr:aspartate-semialdehyde dehydrogenase [Anaplasmataceae bacterium]
MQESGFKVAVVGATGKVGREIIEILNTRKFPISRLFPIASDNSVDKQILFGRYNKIPVETLRNNSFDGIDFAFFATSADISAKYIGLAIKSGCIVIDNSSYFRKTTDIPLIVPEINPEQLYNYKNKNIICNPNCVAIQTLMAIKNFHELSEITKITLSTYQSISGAGQYAVDQLYHQTKNKFMADLGYNAPKADEDYTKYVFNCVPQIGNLMPSNDYEEEDKIKYEIKRIL